MLRHTGSKPLSRNTSAILFGAAHALDLDGFLRSAIDGVDSKPTRKRSGVTGGQRLDP